jgi:hypothetical protein
MRIIHLLTVDDPVDFVICSSSTWEWSMGLGDSYHRFNPDGWLFDPGWEKRGTCNEDCFKIKNGRSTFPDGTLSWARDSQEKLQEKPEYLKSLRETV